MTTRTQDPPLAPPTPNPTIEPASMSSAATYGAVAGAGRADLDEVRPSRLARQRGRWAMRVAEDRWFPAAVLLAAVLMTVLTIAVVLLVI